MQHTSMNWKEEYIDLLGCADTNKLDIENAQKILFKNIPRFLYKYRPDSDFALENLKTNTIWLNNPSEYNDPFECAEYIDISRVTKALFKSKLNDIIDSIPGVSQIPKGIKEKLKFSPNPQEDLVKYICEKQRIKESNHEEKKTIRSISKEILEMPFRDKIKDLQETLKVCSFCESPDNLLMWSHYTNHHKGFCIQYDISINDDHSWKSLFYPVIYQSDIYDSTDHMISSIILNDFNNLYPYIACATKSTEWKYENEWRIIILLSEAYSRQNFAMNCQTKVYLGSRIEKDYEEKIIDICKSQSISVVKAKTSYHSYKLVFEPIC